MRRLYIRFQVLFNLVFNFLERTHYRLKYLINLPQIYTISDNCVFSNKFKSKNISIKNSFYLGDFSKISIESKVSSLQVSEKVRIKDFCSIRILDGKLQIGNNVFINNYTSITCLHKIVIGDNVMIGEGVKFYDHNHKYLKSNLGVVFTESDSYTLGGINVGNNVWIGSNVVILKGVEIGENSIIGAGVVLHKSVPQNSIIVNKQELLFK